MLKGRGMKRKLIRELKRRWRKFKTRTRKYDTGVTNKKFNRKVEKK